MSTWDEETVARIGHDLRGPLAVVSGFAALLAVRGDERLRLEAAEQITAPPISSQTESTRCSPTSPPT